VLVDSDLQAELLISIGAALPAPEQCPGFRRSIPL